MANTSEKQSKIFRYKLNDDLMLNITQFAKIHQLDDRHSYKEAWTHWLAENQDCVDREVSRLQQLNYKGDVIDKMFKAGRYYFREKVAIKPRPIETKDKSPRDYIVMDQALIQAMDEHLQNLMKNNDFKPALAYNHFCEEHIDLLRKEIGRLLQQNITGEKLSAKLKKTYKNRYFILQKH
jgi:hypothetical protein